MVPVYVKKYPVDLRRYPFKVLIVRALYVTILFIIFFSIWRLTTTLTDNGKEEEKDSYGMSPCGDICAYEGTKYSGKYYPLVWKNIECPAIMRRMAWRNHTVVYPPPKRPPPAMLEAFTQNGESPIKGDWYMIGFDPDEHVVPLGFTEAQIEALVREDKAGDLVNSYNDNGLMSATVKDYRQWISGRQGFVIGTEQPWLEAITLNNNASHVTTLAMEPIDFQHPKITVVKPADLADKYMTKEFEKFDFGASYSYIEHAGLGRYGDPLNPYGDLEIMARAWCMMKPGGLFFLSVPVSTDGSSYILWNALRVYGPKRLQQLTAKWHVLELRQSSNGFPQALLVLSKPIP